MSNVLLTYVWRICNVYRLIRYSYASHTQSTLAIRWSHAGHTLTYAGHTLTFADICWSYAGHTLAIRYSYATHRFNTVSIRTILPFPRAFCAYENYFMNCHTQLIRFSHTQWCDRAITDWGFYSVKVPRRPSGDPGRPSSTPVSYRLRLLLSKSTPETVWWPGQAVIHARILQTEVSTQ